MLSTMSYFQFRFRENVVFSKVRVNMWQKFLRCNQYDTQTRTLGNEMHLELCIQVGLKLVCSATWLHHAKQIIRNWSNNGIQKYRYVHVRLQAEAPWLRIFMKF